LIELVRVTSPAGHPILVKAECLQPAGSFKIRGALHVVGSLSSGFAEIQPRSGN
jgi:threonine dehydratase